MNQVGSGVLGVSLRKKVRTNSALLIRDGLCHKKVHSLVFQGPKKLKGSRDQVKTAK